MKLQLINNFHKKKFESIYSSDYQALVSGDFFGLDFSL